MAKKSAVNKSQAIRDALAAHPDKSPSEIAEILKADGIVISAQYVSTIKSNARIKAKRPVGRRGRQARGAAGGSGGAMSTMDAALDRAFKSKEYQDFLNARGFGLVYANAGDFGKFMEQADASLGNAMKAAGLAQAA